MTSFAVKVSFTGPMPMVVVATKYRFAIDIHHATVSDAVSGKANGLKMGAVIATIMLVAMKGLGYSHTASEFVERGKPMRMHARSFVGY